MAQDPICGMTVAESSALSATRDGQIYYFCCETCLARFKGSPPPRSTSSAAFFCPMCPGMESSHPGLCAKCGMALESSGGAPEDTTELTSMTMRLRVALALGIPVLGLAMGPMLVPSLGLVVPAQISVILQLILASPVVAWCGAPLFHRAWLSLRSRQFNMFTLIGLGVGASYISSVMALLSPGLFDLVSHHGGRPIYFEASSTIIVLVLLGQVMELKARHKTGDAIRQLLKMTPSTAYILHQGCEIEVSIDEIRPGNRIRVKPGGKVPVDGIILSGTGLLDASMLTGESDPVEGVPNTEVAAGMLNLTGAFIMEALRVGSDTLIARMTSLVAEAQRSRAPIQYLVDRVSAVFVPAVILASLLTFAAWVWLGPEPRGAQAFVHAISVLIVACPCALGLATPMAVMVGIGRGALDGILIRDAAVIERMSNVGIVVIDKTGTLTEGKPQVVEITCRPGSGSENELLSLAAAVEESSEHPLGQAIVREARRRGLAWPVAERFKSQPGVGVTGVIGEKLVAARKESREQVEQKDPVTRIRISIDDAEAGTISLRDTVRKNARDAVDKLKSMNIRVIMLTGDNRDVARDIGGALGIGEIHAGMTPAGKQELIRALQKSGYCVAMAGDGINDAPALALSDVGMAMETGTDVAIETADVILLRGDLAGIAGALRLSSLVMRNIRENLFWAFAYNILGIAIASGMLYPLWGLGMNPMVAALAMSFSSVTVIGNSLRLRKVTV